MASLRIVALATLTALLEASAAISEEQPAIEFSSGAERVALIELYTSEGCSSCPPADRWLQDLEDDEGLWREFVPVALHVDYWDYLGWPDRFAQPGFADRQRRYAREGGSLTVYTPGVFLNGGEWLGWRRGGSPPADDARPGSLVLRIDGDDVAVTYTATGELPDGLRAHVGVVGMDLETDVRAGENHGRRLTHDFVLTGLASSALYVTGDGRTARAELTLDAPDSGRIALVGWISAESRQAPLQATGGYLR